MRIQEIAKVLNKAGLKKKSSKRVGFETVYTGHYEARLFNYNGILGYILPVNGTKAEQVIDILAKAGISCKENRGYVVIPK